MSKPVETMQIQNNITGSIPATIVSVPPDNPPPSSTAWPTRAITLPKKANETMTAELRDLTITILYDNNPYDPRLRSDWGFSALVEYHGQVLLFDTGSNGSILLNNMSILGIDPGQIKSIVLSHAHGDHTNGLSTLLQLGIRPTLYLLPSFPNTFKSEAEKYTKVILVEPGRTIVAGFITTGEMGKTIPEQAIVIETDSGIVVITGCAHPGIVSIVEKAQAMVNKRVLLVLGGFHLTGKSNSEVDLIVKDFQKMGVKYIAPCHCTGQRAIQKFKAAFGNDFIQVGVGKVIHIGVQ